MRRTMIEETRDVPDAEPPPQLLSRAVGRPVAGWLKSRHPEEEFAAVFACDRENRWYFVGYFPRPAVYGEGPDADAFRQVLEANKMVKCYRREVQTTGDGSFFWKLVPFEAFAEPGVEVL